ncbi:predicted protein [Sclerotinia sclerotiorum 1980 UF-70]|uniref:Uncharacterized protein n=1 Tax=Sclerotinia sclerotiorum (strain ATCC 18683 / 1980 / Ss-1) TaxID=665079 RepID=A7F364_SCLS1|nr:predicted protein [Sclerotinia sclerotiorum 1980 UF-70]EDN97185.1 predicted protein [Sclerotinia sclerotiorum 1980 UF-70]
MRTICGYTGLEVYRWLRGVIENANGGMGELGMEGRFWHFALRMYKSGIMAAEELSNEGDAFSKIHSSAKHSADITAAE